MSYLPPEQLLRFCYILLQTDSTSVTSFCQLEYFDNIPVFFPSFFHRTHNFSPLFRFFDELDRFLFPLFFCMRPAWNTFPCLVSFFFILLLFSHSALSALFFRKYFLKIVTVLFLLFDMHYKPFPLFDAFSNFLLTFYFYMIFLSTYGIIFKKKEKFIFYQLFFLSIYT